VLLIAAVVIMFGLLNKQCNDIKALESDHLKDSLKTTIKNQKRIELKYKLFIHFSFLFEILNSTLKLSN
jgi:hypothetical protein